MNDLVDIIAVLSRHLAQSEESFREHPSFRHLSLTQLHYLEAISKLGNPSLSELATALDLKKPTVTVTVDRLAEKGFVVRVRSDTDRRSAHLHLTAKGDLINQLHDQAHRMLAQSFSDSMNTQELEDMMRLLRKVIDKWNKNYI